jgi:hypothetical protein
MLYIIILKIGSGRKLVGDLIEFVFYATLKLDGIMSPAGGGRMVEHFKLSSGGWIECAA